jgi:hypothetical protein
LGVLDEENEMKKLLLLIAALVALGSLVACAQPTPEVIEKEVVVEKRVVQTVIVEKPVVQTVVVEKAIVVEKPVEETVIVEKPVVQTVVVEKAVVVEKPVVQTVVVEKAVMVKETIEVTRVVLQTVEVTRVVPQTVEVTKIVQVVVSATPRPATPIPTSTPYPTHTPYPTVAPTPTPTMCNPSWRNPHNLNLRVASSPGVARTILENELRRWTKVVPWEAGLWYGNVEIYLTYLSPQVIEAIVAEKAVRDGLSSKESQDLLAEFDRRLQIRNAIPFLLTIRGDRDDEVLVTLGPLEQTMVMVSQRRQEFRPLTEYTPALASPINMVNGGLEGYVLFPRSVGSGCNPTINFLDDHSFDVRLSAGSVIQPGLLGPFETKHLSSLWPFTLLPEIPLEQAKEIPLPERAADIDTGILLDILGLALNIFQLLMTPP